MAASLTELHLSRSIGENPDAAKKSLHAFYIFIYLFADAFMLEQSEENIRHSIYVIFFRMLILSDSYLEREINFQQLQ